MSDRAAKIIARGDPEEILRMALGARFAAEDGRFCEREEPSLHGRDLMCGNCLLENEGQIERLEELIRGPHEFESSERSDAARRMGWCGICAHPKDDPRHEIGAESRKADCHTFASGESSPDLCHAPDCPDRESGDASSQEPS